MQIGDTQTDPHKQMQTATGTQRQQQTETARDRRKHEVLWQGRSPQHCCRLSPIQVRRFVLHKSSVATLWGRHLRYHFAIEVPMPLKACIRYESWCKLVWHNVILNHMSCCRKTVLNHLFGQSGQSYTKLRILREGVQGPGRGAPPVPPL